MNRKKHWGIGFLGILSATALLMGSCGKEKDLDPNPPITGEVTNADINRWVLDSMKVYYYWTDFIPANPNLNAAPPQFFESILKRPDDRFSWIQNNEDLRNQLSGVIKTSGLGLGWFLVGANNAGAAVRFVHKGSPADLAGIKRGDLFIKVNGAYFTANGNQITNADPIFGNETFTLTRGILNEGVISAGSDVTLTPVENFQETAILLDTVLTTPNNTKVGYLFYNRFLSNQAQQLVNAFGRFKSAGITELIIDERYNSGGGINVAGVLSGMIHKNFNVNAPYILYNFNQRLGGTIPLTYGDVFGAANGPVVSNNNLGLDRVFILATGSSASASELLINNLRPFMGASNVVHIGSPTRGKDDASITISNSDTSRFKGENDWGIQPIILKYANRDGEGNFVDGLIPAHQVSESIPYAPMGSEEDPLIGKALSIIDPSIQALYNRRMSIQRQRALPFDMQRFEEFNVEQTRPIPLDVTETLKDRKAGESHQLHLK
ncbi:MAG TPA: S41 family peptidase [Sphingobacteriaceae bacterium]|nr:S41 family peptidase [Sphingobacteriaceae bacterium]